MPKPPTCDPIQDATMRTVKVDNRTMAVCEPNFYHKLEQGITNVTEVTCCKWESDDELAWMPKNPDGSLCNEKIEL